MINKYFLAKMNIPAYLKKFLYNSHRYTEIEGVPPIIFKGNGENLLDYRIYGAGGGVGDRTNNLIPNLSEWINGYIKQSDGTLMNSTSSKEKTSPFIEVNLNDEFTFSYDIGSNEKWAAVAYYDQNKNFIWRSVQYTTTQFTFTINIENAKYIRLSCNTYDNEIYPNLNFGSTNIPYEPYGYKVPVVVSSKNFLRNTATTQVKNGVTFTVNNDRSVTLTGSPERSFDISFNNSVILNPGTYIYTNGLTQSDSRIRVDMYVPGGNINYWANPSVTFTTTNTYKFVSRIFIQGNAGELGGLTIYPMIRKADIEDGTYEQYIELTTNIYLDEPIEENESISLSDTNVNIPTIKGTNVLSVDTEVQPSNVYIKVGGG